MSDLVFGLFYFESDQDDEWQASFSRKVHSLGLEHGLYVAMGPNVIQQEVFEALGLTSHSLQPAYLVFVVTGSPISDVSDDAIWPDATGDEFMLQVPVVVQRLTHFLSSCLAHPEVTKIDLVVSGAGDPIPRLATTLDVSTLPDLFLAHVAGPYYLRSFRVMLTADPACEPSDVPPH